jgi:hypothetical protein
VDDRILFVPPSWSPDPAVLEMFAAFQALLARLRAFLPVDIFIWPWLKTQKLTGTGTECLFNAIRDQVRPHHHVLQAPSGYGEAFLEVLAERQPRSLVVFGFNPSLRTVALLTGGATPPGLQAFWEVSLRDATQLLRLVMAGADEADIQRIAQARDRSYDRELALAVGSEFEIREPAAVQTLDVPALYLSATEILSTSKDERFAVFRRYVPGARHEELKESAPRWYEEAGGHELANKVIPFIQEVIAQREAAGQT